LRSPGLVTGLRKCPPPAKGSGEWGKEKGKEEENGKGRKKKEKNGKWKGKKEEENGKGGKIFTSVKIKSCVYGPGNIAHFVMLTKYFCCIHKITFTKLIL